MNLQQKNEDFIFKPITKDNVQDLRNINNLMLPIHYSDFVYKKILKEGKQYSFVVFDKENAVASIACVPDKNLNLTIISICVLSSHQGKSIASKMLKLIIDSAKKDSKIENIDLMVQTKNNEAIHLYKKFNFEIIETKENYYKKLEEKDAFQMKLKL